MQPLQAASGLGGVSRRRMLASLGAGLVGAALAACSGPGGGAPAAGNKAPAKLTFMSWRPIAMDQFAPAWKEYQQKQNVTITVDPSGDSAQEKITTMFAADTGPDLFDASQVYLPRMYDSGFVLEITKYLTRDKVNLDKDWAVLGTERWRQKTYGVPYWAEPHSIFYNKTLFRTKGVPDPWEKPQNKGQWTIEEMVDAARKINDPSNDVYGMQWGMGDYHGIGALVWTHLVSHLQYDPQMKFDLQLPQYVTALNTAIDWMMRLRINVAAPTPEMGDARTRLQAGRPAIDQPNGFNAFSSGKVGIHWRSVNDWRRMWNSIGTAFEWDMMPTPNIDGKPGATWSAGHPVNAYSKTKEPDACWAFMHYLMEDEFQSVLAENQFLVPAKKKHQPRFFRVPPQYPYQHPTIFADVYKRPYGLYWTHYRAGENTTLYNNEIAKVIRGEQPMQGTLQNLQQQLNAQIETGPGENPFKGIRWPLQPK